MRHPRGRVSGPGPCTGAAHAFREDVDGQNTMSLEANFEIPLSRPDITELEIDHVLQVLRSGRLSIGPVQEQFEARMADLTGTDHAVAVSSGTCGLHLALLALGIGPGDEVITTPFSFIATANAIIYTGARPVFVDREKHIKDFLGFINKRHGNPSGSVSRLNRVMANGTDVCGSSMLSRLQAGRAIPGRRPRR